MITNKQPLKDKRIAVLGGMGARPEAEQKLIEELELAELDWILSERNQGKPFANFTEGLRPGRYDYVFILTKFISHKSQNAVDRAKQLGIPVIRVTGSYNPENFIAALFGQAVQKEEPKPIQEPPKPIITKVLEPAQPDTTSKPVTIDPTLTHEPSQEVEQWKKMFGAPTPEKAKAKIEMRERALESRIATLKVTQQDKKILNFAYDYINSMERFLEDVPVPSYVEDAKEPLIKSLKKHGYAFEKKEYGGTAPDFSDKDTMFDNILKTNTLFSGIYNSTTDILKALSSPKYDKRGACLSCGIHQSKGCDPNCSCVYLKKLLDFFAQAAKYNPNKDVPVFPPLPEKPLVTKTTIEEKHVIVDGPGARPTPLETLPRKMRRFFEKKFGIK